jgi:hypothetical protein
MDVTDNGSGYLINTELKPVIYLVRGHTYLFSMLSSLYNSHQFTFRETGQTTAYGVEDGVDVLEESNGFRQIKFRVKFSAPNQLDYYSATEGDSGFGNTITIIPQLS